VLDASLLACDWGTTHLRAWVVDPAGRVLRRKTFPFGVARLTRGEAAVKFKTEVRPALDASRLPALLCGMVGSTLGWTTVPYCRCPAGLPEIAAGTAQVESNPPTWIVPGLVGPGVESGPDVMRGEETQVLGWIFADATRANGHHGLCHPGTHSKWVRVKNGSIVSFVTAMTGELFDVLRRHSVLRDDAPPDDESSFDEGVAAAGDGNGLAYRLFTTRSRAVTGDAPRSTTSYLSGLLVGAEVASLPCVFEFDPARPIALLGNPQLCRWYERAMARAGIRTTFFDGEDAVILGLLEIRRQMSRT
jgi:2-dehydro-3-deoxygalactonokinase